MTRHGFTQADLEEGWQLMMAAAGAKLAVFHYVPDPTLFEELDVWENLWFPIAYATLRRHYPAVCDEVFLNLTQTEGLDVAVSVGTLVRRVRQAQQSDSEDERAAVALLATRGLDETTLGKAEDLLGRLRTDPEAAVPEPTNDRKAAEEAMWAWYLEWSAIARQIIQDRNLLRSLGFLRRAAGGSDEDLEEELDQSESDSVETQTVNPKPEAA
jgi:Sec-independent protein translocase protein TatA